SIQIARWIEILAKSASRSNKGPLTRLINSGAWASSSAFRPQIHALFTRETEAMNVFEGLKRSRTFRGEETALWIENVILIYESLIHKALLISYSLKKEGVGRGYKVCLFSPNVQEFVMSYYAAAAIGGVVVSINVMNKRDEVSYIVNDCDAKAL